MIKFKVVCTLTEGGIDKESHFLDQTLKLHYIELVLPGSELLLLKSPFSQSKWDESLRGFVIMSLSNWIRKQNGQNS